MRLLLLTVIAFALAPLANAQESAIAPLGASAQTTPAPAPAKTTAAPVYTVQTHVEEPKSYDIRIGAPSLLIGALSANLDIAVLDSFTVGPEVTYWSLSINDTKAAVTYLGVRSNYYFGRPALSQGWYLGPFADYLKVSVTESINGLPASGEATGWTVGAIFGYNWMWDNFNINLGLGGAIRKIDRVTARAGGFSSSTDVNLSGGGPSGEFTVGWAF